MWPKASGQCLWYPWNLNMRMHTHMHSFRNVMSTAGQLPWIHLLTWKAADLPPRSVYLWPQNEMGFAHPWVAHWTRRTISGPLFFIENARLISIPHLWLEHQWYAGKIRKTHPGNFDVGLYVRHPRFVKSARLLVGPYVQRSVNSINTNDAGATGTKK